MASQTSEYKKSKYEMDLCDGSIVKKLLLFTLPIMLSSMLQLLFNAADVAVVGKFAGDASLAAVGSTTALINLLTNVFIGLSVGTNVVTARHFAAKEEREVSKTVHTSIYISIVGGIILTVIGIIFAPMILTLMGSPDEVLDLAAKYLRIYFLGMTATTLYNFGSSVLRAIGDTRRPLIFLIISGIINVVLNLLLVATPLAMGVAGVAIATAISQCVSAVLVVICLMKEKSSVHLDWKKVKIHKEKLIIILKIGLPAGIQGSLFSLSNVVIQSAVNSFGKIVIAGNSAAANLEGFVYVAMNSFHQSAITFISQNVGAQKYKRINRIIFISIGCVTVVGVILGGSVAFFGKYLLRIYSSSPDVITAGVLRLKYICIVYFLCGIMDVLVGILRGLGKSITPMIVSLMGACVFRLVWVYTIFQIERFHLIETIYISYAISWILTALTHTIVLISTRKHLKKIWNE